MWLWGLLADAGADPSATLHHAAGQVALAELRHASSLGADLESLRGRSVLILAREQLAATLALLELDGVARRLVLCPADLQPEHVPPVARAAEADACIVDTPEQALRASLSGVAVLRMAGTLTRVGLRRSTHLTEWVLLTSGTTGVPKLVVHTLESLTSAFAGQERPRERILWSTFYDIRRYGGLQILLRGLHAGGLLLSSAAEGAPEFLARAGSVGVTHISGTPSQWRKALMSGAALRIAPRYVRLSGEIADQGILDALRGAYPHAVVAHAFASTEAGVGFEVRDGLAGFPASLLQSSPGSVEMDVAGGTLRLRSPGVAQRYLGSDALPLRDSDGFVDTHDRLELREGRYFFVGRSGGVINVGGLKVYPEEVEAVINSHPWVRMSLVKERRNPITGAVVTADVVLADTGALEVRPAEEVLRMQIQESCRAALAAHKVPMFIRIVPSLEVSASGKLVRPGA
ncbi:MAG TPA: AMP-binding protein [Steroidobacteraceae bacterium]|nr:AMP-binding protein [Steroidobacteraceae bacterium]